MLEAKKAHLPRGKCAFLIAYKIFIIPKSPALPLLYKLPSCSYPLGRGQLLLLWYLVLLHSLQYGWLVHPFPWKKKYYLFPLVKRKIVIIKNRTQVRFFCVIGVCGGGFIWLCVEDKAFYLVLWRKSCGWRGFSTKPVVYFNLN